LIKIYTGDWRNTDSGIIYSKPGTEPRSLSEWISLKSSQMVISAGATEKIYYEISLPEDQTLNGSYWGMIFVEECPSSSGQPANHHQDNSLYLNSIVRYAAKIYVTVDGTEIKKASFTAAHVAPAKEGGLDITASFKNKSNSYLKPAIWLEVHDSTGKKILTQDYKKLFILPDVTMDCTFQLRDINLKPGSYNSLVIADFGALSLVAAQIQIKIE
jgi:hypothetical protein